MTYVSTRRFYNEFGRRMARFFLYRKARRLYKQINREISVIESRFVKSRLHHA